MQTRVAKIFFSFHRITYLCTYIYYIKMKTSKIEIKDEVLRQGAEEGMDEFIKVFTDKYLEVTGGVINAETMPLLNGYQHSLLGYHFFS